MYGKMNFNVFYFKCEFGSGLRTHFCNALKLLRMFFILIVMTNLLVKTVELERERGKTAYMEHVTTND